MRKPFFILLSFLVLANLKAQESELNSITEELKASIKNVQASKSSFEQIIQFPKSGIVNLTRVETNSKGDKKDSRFEFNLADIDINTVRTETRRDLILVVMSVKVQQKLVKFYQEGKVKSYDKEVEIFTPNIDNAREMAELLKKAIPFAEQLSENSLSLNSYSESIEWLTKNIQPVEVDDKRYSFSVKEGDYAGQLQIIQNVTGSKSQTNEEYLLNLADINPISIQFKITGNKFYVTMEMDRKRKLIQYRKDGELKPYVKSMDIIVDNVEAARDLKTALELVIPMAQKEVEKSLPTLDSRETTLLYLEKQVIGFTDGDKDLSQKMNPYCQTRVRVIEKKDSKAVENLFEINLIDIDPATAEFEIKGKSVVVNPVVTGKNKLIKHWKDGELQNYDNSFSLYASTVENGRRITHAFKNAIEYCTNEYESTVAEGGIKAKVDWIIENVSEVSLGDKTFKQSLGRSEADLDNKLAFSKTEVGTKNTTEEVFEFNLSDIDPKGISLDITGKLIAVKLESNYDQKVINYYKNGEIKNYQSNVKILARNIELARNLKIALTEAASLLNKE